MAVTPPAPGGQRLPLGKEFFQAGPGNARLATAVGFATQADDDIGHDAGQERIAGGVGRNDAVAVEVCTVQQLPGVGDIVQRYALGPGSAVPGQDAPRRRQQPAALGGGFVDRRQWQMILVFQQDIRIFEQAAGPAGGGDDFTGTDAAVAVAVDQIQCAAVEDDAPRRAG